MAGAMLVFFGLFGRGFVLGPLFVVGMYLLTLGLENVVLGYLAGVPSVGEPADLLGGIAYHPELNEPFVLAGVMQIAGNGFHRFGQSPSRLTDRWSFVRLLGVAVVAIGAVLVLFGLEDLRLERSFSVFSMFWVEIDGGAVIASAGWLALASSYVGKAIGHHDGVRGEGEPSLRRTHLLRAAIMVAFGLGYLLFIEDYPPIFPSALFYLFPRYGPFSIPSADISTILILVRQAAFSFGLVGPFLYLLNELRLSFFARKSTSPLTTLAPRAAAISGLALKELPLS
jgi:hypothetical protein